MRYAVNELRKKVYNKIVYSVHPFHEIDNANQCFQINGQKDRSMCACCTRVSTDFCSSL